MAAMQAQLPVLASNVRYALTTTFVEIVTCARMSSTRIQHTILRPCRSPWPVIAIGAKAWESGARVVAKAGGKDGENIAGQKVGAKEAKAQVPFPLHLLVPAP